MPDAEGNPTDSEVVQALGWTPAAADESVPLVATEPAPSEAAPATPVAGAPAAPVAAAPAPAPVAAAPAPVPAYTPPPPAPDPMAQQREMELSQLRQQNTINQINGQAQQYMNQKMGEGWDEAHAREAATQYAQNLYSNYQGQEGRRIANEQAKTARAYELSHQYGAPADMLRAYDTPAAMEQAAKMYQATQGRIQGLEQRLAAQNKAPVQSFDSNRMTGSGSPMALKMRYATDGNFEPTDAQLAQIIAG